jgi:hypothetical protein
LHLSWLATFDGPLALLKVLSLRTMSPAHVIKERFKGNFCFNLYGNCNKINGSSTAVVVLSPLLIVRSCHFKFPHIDS